MKLKVLIFSSLVILILLIGCESITDEIFAPEIIEPDSLGFISVSTSGVTLKYKVEDTDLHCILSGNTSGWVSVGFDPTSMMKNGNVIIGYVSSGNGFIRDDWGVSNTTHVADVSLGGSVDVTLLSASESGGTTELEFKIPLDSGDSYDKAMQLDQTYPIILARGNIDDFDSMHSAAGYSEITITETEGGGGNGNTTAMPDTTLYLSLEKIGMKFYWLVDADTIHCVVTAPTTGWVGIGFDPDNIMEGANFIVGYVESDSIGFIRDDWGTSPTLHVSDLSNGGSEDIYNLGGMESNGESIIYFSMPLDSGDAYDKPLLWNESYPLILAYGNDDSFAGMHANADFSSFTVDNTTGGGGGGGGGNSYAFPDTTLYLSLETIGMKFYWLVDPDTIHCVVSAPTSGWVAVGFDPSNVMQDANFIIGYVESDTIGFVRDDWGNTPTVHSADVNNGGTEDIYYTGGLESGGETFIYFSMPLDSGDSYDKPLLWDTSYPIILAYGNDDSFTGMHANAGFSSFTVDNTTGGGNNGVTTGGDISLDNDTQGFNAVVKSDITFKWKVVGDSLRCMVLAPTTGWLAVGFDPTEEMQDANFIIGYVNNGTTFVRDDFGVSETMHSADVGLGGENHVNRVFGHEESGISEMRFTIPLNSGDQYDRILIPGQTYEIILAFGFNGADDFTSMHDEADNTDIDL